MMGKVYPDPASDVAFRCTACGYNFSSEPRQVIDDPSRPWHPFRYTCGCPNCGGKAEQASWEVNLYKARANATGPKTPEGLAASAKNLDGHPTPEEAARTRFNAMKHGLRAQTATYFPARPGAYPHCIGCDFLDGCEEEVACMKRTELFMRHHIAFETRDPTLLAGLRANLQASIAAIIDDIVLAIVQDGVRLKAPRWYYDQQGVFHLAEYTDSDGEKRLIEEVTAHPLLKTLGDLVAKNGMTLTDEGMTMRQQGDAIDPDAHRGRGVSPEDMKEFQERSQQQMQSLMKLIARSDHIIDVTPSDG